MPRLSGVTCNMDENETPGTSRTGVYKTCSLAGSFWENGWMDHRFCRMRIMIFAGLQI